jgi:hypothetical protein
MVEFETVEVEIWQAEVMEGIGLVMNRYVLHHKRTSITQDFHQKIGMLWRTG